MRFIGLAGWSGAGKTTLLRKLIPALVAEGLRVSTLKHAHHAFEIDQPGKDSYEHREAGATEVLVASATRWALIHEHRGAAEPALPALPGWDPACLAAIVAAVARQPDVGGVRTLHLALGSMAGGDPLDATEAARQAGLTSGMGRHRMRLALEGLCARGVLRRQGERFALRAPGDQGD